MQGLLQEKGACDQNMPDDQHCEVRWGIVGALVMQLGAARAADVVDFQIAAIEVVVAARWAARFPTAPHSRRGITRSGVRRLRRRCDLDCHGLTWPRN